MIRITLKNGRYFNYEYCEFENEIIDEEAYCYVYTFGTDIFKKFLWEEILKIEKQVNDLTKKEMFEYVKLEFKVSAVLNVYEYGITISYYDNLKRRMVDLVFGNDDYIDITDIVKGGK